MKTNPNPASISTSNMSEIEANICKSLAYFLIRCGYLIKVCDGDEGGTIQSPTADLELILSASAQTEITAYEVYHQFTPERITMIASFTLVHGNGADLISDASCIKSPWEVSQLMEAASDYAGRGLYDS